MDDFDFAALRRASIMRCDVCGAEFYWKDTGLYSRHRMAHLLSMFIPVPLDWLEHRLMHVALASCLCLFAVVVAMYFLHVNIFSTQCFGLCQ